MKNYKEYALELWNNGERNKTDIARKIKKDLGVRKNIETIRKMVSYYVNRQDAPALFDECEQRGLPPENVSNYWYKGKHFSIHLKGNKGPTYDEIREDMIKELNQYSPKFPKITRKPCKDGHLLVIDPADIHIGKLAKAVEGEEYNSSIAVQRVKEGIQGILDKSSGWNIDQILFIGGNDILHVDTPNSTSKGTRQDVDGMWYESFLTAKKLYVECLEMLLSVAPIHFTFNPSNHDYISGFMLADTIGSWFRKCKDITFDCSIRHRKGFKYHNNLIGTTHGDGAKNQDLPLLMAHEFPKEWASTKHRYVFTHHVHHKQSKDFIGVTVESLRSPSGSDSWHSKAGYIGSPKAVEGFVHHKQHGQVARLTHLF